MSLLAACKKCDVEFITKPYWVKNGGGKYCSLKCKYQSSRKGKEVACFGCGKMIYRKPTSINRSKSKKYFCGPSCQTVWRNQYFSGPKHANWIHGKSSYRSVLSRNKIIKMCRLCNTKDERVMAVHHIDKNRLNNKIANLAWLCHNCHFLVHHHNDEREKFMVAMV